MANGLCLKNNSSGIFYMKTQGNSDLFVTLYESYDNSDFLEQVYIISYVSQHNNLNS